MLAALPAQIVGDDGSGDADRDAGHMELRGRPQVAGFWEEIGLCAVEEFTHRELALPGEEGLAVWVALECEEEAFTEAFEPLLRHVEFDDFAVRAFFYERGLNRNDVKRTARRENEGGEHAPRIVHVSPHVKIGPAPADDEVVGIRGKGTQLGRGVGGAHGDGCVPAVADEPDFCGRLFRGSALLALDAGVHRATPGAQSDEREDETEDASE